MDKSETNKIDINTRQAESQEASKAGGDPKDIPEPANFAQPKKEDNYPYHDYSGGEEVEEFVYKPKVGFVFKKLVKPLIALAVIVLIITPLVFLVLKFSPKVQKPSVKKGEIVWWGIGLKKEVVEPLIEEYQNANPKVSITYEEESPIDYRERLANSLAQGKGPDIFRFHNSWVPMFKNNLDFLPKDVISQDEYYKSYYPVIVRDLTTASGIVGMPLEYDALTLFINDDIFAAAGKIPPRTWDEFHQLAVDLTVRGQQGLIIQSGSSLGITGNVDYWPEIVALLMLQNKVNLFRPSGSSAEEAISFYADFGTFAKVWDGTLPTSTEAFADGKVAMFFAPIRAVDSIKAINKNIKFKTVLLPQVRRDDPTEPEVTYATYWVEGVWNKSPNKDLAWDFLKFLSKKESLEKLYKNSIASGLSGEPYPRVDMRDILINDSTLGSVLALAPNAKSGCLASKTNDGNQGLNSLLNAIYKTGIDGLVATRNRKGVKAVIDTIAAESAKVYAKFGVSSQ